MAPPSKDLANATSPRTARVTPTLTPADQARKGFGRFFPNYGGTWARQCFVISSAGTPRVCQPAVILARGWPLFLHFSCGDKFSNLSGRGDPSENLSPHCAIP